MSNVTQIKKDSKSRTYCLTINNYNDEHIEQLKKLKCLYIIIGDETGEKGTKHLQIFFRLKSQAFFSTIKKKFPTAHIEPAKGSDSQNRDYCSKQQVLYEDGEPTQQGKRNDIDDVKEMMEDPETANMRSIVPICRSTQAVRMAEIHLKYFERKRSWKPKVKWFYGTTGTGKTREAYNQAESDPYTCMATTKWWEGYDAHDYVIIDDMRKDFCKFHDLLRMLDRYPYLVECKGGSRQLLAKTIVITTTSRPEDLYSGREDINQLLRRIDEIRQFGEPQIKLKINEIASQPKEEIVNELLTHFENELV